MRVIAHLYTGSTLVVEDASDTATEVDEPSQAVFFSVVDEDDNRLLSVPLSNVAAVEWKYD